MVFVPKRIARDEKYQDDGPFRNILRDFTIWPALQPLLVALCQNLV